MRYLTLPASTAAPSATTEQNQALREDVAQVLALRALINQQTQHRFDSTRVVAVTAASPGGEQYLPYTIPTLIKQIARAGKRADIVIGLNNGYECPHTIADLGTLLDTEIIHLYTGDKPGADIPAPIFATAECQDEYRIVQESGQHRIFVLHQRQGPHAAGKARILGDICHSLLLDNIAQGWIPPAYLLMFDQETVILEDPDDYDLVAGIEKVQRILEQGMGVEGTIQRLITDHFAANRQQAPRPRQPATPALDLDGRGADKLIERLEQSGADIISVRWKNCVYNIETFYRSVKVVLPNLNLDPSILHRIVYDLTGIAPQTSTFSGGCTLGKIDALLAIHACMYRTYPGLIGEDALASVLAYNAGFSAFTERSLYNTNRCPAAQETVGTPPVAVWKDQYARWIAGNDAIERLYGHINITPIQGPGEQMSDVVALAIFAKTLHQTNDVAKAFAMLQELQAAQEDFEEIKQMATKKQYVYKGNYTQASWW